jgi:hypothetical protein
MVGWNGDTENGGIGREGEGNGKWVLIGIKVSQAGTPFTTGLEPATGEA